MRNNPLRTATGARGAVRLDVPYVLAALVVGVFALGLFYAVFIAPNSPLTMVFNRKRFELHRLEQVAFTHYHAQAYDKAEPELEEIIAKDPGNVKAHLALGIVRARTGKPDKAVEELKKVIELDPGYHEAYASLGAISEKRGTDALDRKSHEEALRRFRDAEDYYRKALSVLNETTSGTSKALSRVHRGVKRMNKYDKDVVYDDQEEIYRQGVERVQEYRRRVP
ncbi:MAG: tetratricopeptide repeat protein [bacterium]